MALEPKKNQNYKVTFLYPLFQESKLFYLPEVYLNKYTFSRFFYVKNILLIYFLVSF